jgi:hypothetical protein
MGQPRSSPIPEIPESAPDPVSPSVPATITPNVVILGKSLADATPPQIEERRDQVKLRLKVPFIGRIDVDLDRIFRRGN